MDLLLFLDPNIKIKIYSQVLLLITIEKTFIVFEKAFHFKSLLSNYGNYTVSAIIYGIDTSTTI